MSKGDLVVTSMRTVLFGCLSGLVLLSRVSLAAAATPIPFDTRIAASFLLSTCQSSANNLDAVAALTEQQKWTSTLDPNVPKNDLSKATGMWRIGQNGQFYNVTTGLGPRRPDGSVFEASIIGSEQ